MRKKKTFRDDFLRFLAPFWEAFGSPNLDKKALRNQTKNEMPKKGHDRRIQGWPGGLRGPPLKDYF